MVSVYKGDLEMMSPIVRCTQGPNYLFVRIRRWSAKFVLDLIPHRTNIFLGLAHLGRDHLP